MDVRETRFDDLSVSAVILNFNGGNNLLRCIQALDKQRSLLKQIILVDNGSSDNSADTVKQSYPTIELIQTGQNLGIAKGRNIGLERATSELVLLLDDDIYIQENTIQRLVFSLRQKNAAVVCPRILLYPQSDIVQCDGAEPHFIGNLNLLNGWVKETSLTQTSSYVGGCIGACMLVDRKIINSLGNFNDEYFFYFEDLEFSLRVRAMGYSIVCDPEAYVFHERGSGTEGISYREKGYYPPLRAYYTIRHRWLTILLIYKLRTILLLTPLFLIFEIGTIIFCLQKGWIKEWLKAVVSIFNIREKIIRWRREIQSKRLVGDSTLLKSGTMEFAPGVIETSFQTKLLSLYSQMSNNYWNFLIHNFLRNG